MSGTSAARTSFDGPAVYSIAVRGRLGEEWCDRLGGMTITVFVTEGGESLTTLVGVLLDQAALSGVLDTLYGLHLPVISVQRLGDS